jgi:hypothetical protein
MTQWVVFVSWIWVDVLKQRCSWMHKEWDKVSDMPFENKSMARPLGDQGALSWQWGLVCEEARCQQGWDDKASHEAKCFMPWCCARSKVFKGTFCGLQVAWTTHVGKTFKLGTAVVGL